MKYEICRVVQRAFMTPLVRHSMFLISATLFTTKVLSTLGEVSIQVRQMVESDQKVVYVMYMTSNAFCITLCNCTSKSAMLNSSLGMVKILTGVTRDFAQRRDTCTLLAAVEDRIQMPFRHMPFRLRRETYGSEYLCFSQMIVPVH